MAEGREIGLGARLAIGGIAGLVATLALVATVRRLRPRDGRDLPAPDASTFLAPFAYGAICGALIAAAEPRPGRALGMLAGGGLWLGGEAGLLPKVEVGPASGRPARRAATLLVGHLAWGWAAAEAMRGIGDSVAG